MFKMSSKFISWQLVLLFIFLCFLETLPLVNSNTREARSVLATFPTDTYYVPQFVPNSSILETTRSHLAVKMELIGWRWAELEQYIFVAVFLLLAALIKIIYHHLDGLHTHIPESVGLIFLGAIIGLIYHSVDAASSLSFNREHFFMILLPPIILESAYSLHEREFFFNLKSILLYAIVGTIMNISLIGGILYLSGKIGLSDKIPFLEIFTFSTIISAVDPVAVLAIFHEIGVNKSLYFLVFGESLLNDAVVITIYNTMTTFLSLDHISNTDLLIGTASFFSVSLGGLTIGILMGIFTSLITRVTSRIRVVEPLVVVALAYLSYVISELFHFSGIIGLIAAGLVQSEYAMDNISDNSLITIKYFTKTMSSISDVIIFFYLGRVLVREDHVWSFSFVTISTITIIIVRFLSVFILSIIANKCLQSVRRINLPEQLIMAYGGLRGAIAFSLVINLDDSKVENSRLFITTCLFLILFTVTILGSTTKPVIKWLKVKLISKSADQDNNHDDEKKNLTMFEEITDRTISTIMSGIEEIAGCSSVHSLEQKFDRINYKILKKFLTSNYQNNHSFKNRYQVVQHNIIRRSVDYNQDKDLGEETLKVPLSGTLTGSDDSVFERPSSNIRKKVLKKSATLAHTSHIGSRTSSYHSHHLRPSYHHSQSNIENYRTRRRTSSMNVQVLESTSSFVSSSRRRSSHNRRIVSTLFDTSEFYHLPRRDTVVESSGLRRSIRRTSSRTSRRRNSSVNRMNIDIENLPIPTIVTHL